MKNPMYQLPTIEFIGGESISLVWNLWAVSPTATINQGSPFDANGCTVTFSLVNFTDKSDIPLISKACTISEGESGTMSVATVFLSSSDTVNMEGKYIY